MTSFQFLFSCISIAQRTKETFKEQNFLLHIMLQKMLITPKTL